MLNHHPPIVDDDETTVPVAILPTTTITGRRSSKSVTKTTGRSFGRVMARVGMGLLLLLLVAEGAIVLPEEEKKGALWLDRGSFSPGRRTTARRVVGADRAATAAAEEEGVVVTEDGYDDAGDHESSVMTQRKIAKGSKKNPSLLFREEVGISLVAPQEIEVPDLKAKVAEVVLGILNEEYHGNVGLALSWASIFVVVPLRPGITSYDALRQKIYSFAVQITRMTEEECTEKYSNDDVLCHKATVMIESKEAFKDRFSELKELLGNVLDAHAIVLYPDKGGYPYVTITNKTPYNSVGFPLEIRVVEYTGGSIICSPDKIFDGIAAYQTWSATSRGVCLVKSIDATLSTPTGWKKCVSYKSSGTSYSQFYIIMNGENECCVQSSHESGVCDPTNQCALCGDRSNCCHPNGGWNSDCPGCASSF